MVAADSSVDHTAVAMLVMVVFWQAMTWWQEKHTCHYCGAYRGHEPNCPYNI